MALRLGRTTWRLALTLLVAAGAACGSSSHHAPGYTWSDPPVSFWTPGVYQSWSSLENLCAAPRTGMDPFTGYAYPDRRGSLAYEKLWLRSYTNDTYLWFAEGRDPVPPGFATALDYFAVLKTGAVTASGRGVDQFHYAYPTATWEASYYSGSSAGYGTTLIALSTRSPRKYLIAYTEPGSPADTAGVGRGTEILTVDGVDLVNAAMLAQTQAEIDKLNAGLFPSAAGQHHIFGILDQGASTPRDVTLVSVDVVSSPVQNVKVLPTATGPVGYLTFHDHLPSAQEAFKSAVATLAASSPPITDMVIDMRYNGGGLLTIAAEVGYMVAGPNRTAGKRFELTQFNDKHPTTDPVNGGAILPTPFQATTINWTGGQAAGVALPHLDLPRVFVLTGTGTASASESVINGLRGAGVEVIQVGSTTRGKPYGFYPYDNCGTTYFTIQFRGINQLGFGDYTDGFSPQNSAAAVPGSQATLPGCAVADDFTHLLGDPAEARLAAALAWRSSQTCPAPSAALLRTAPAFDGSLVEGDGEVLKPEFLKNRIMTR
jgi:carboxyl-terminal processing protease